jgi:hypothetical protein
MATKNGNPRNAPQEPAKPRPAHEVRLGRIKATIWANQADNGTWFNVTLSRSYKDGNDWKSSNSFGRDELLVVAKVADLAHSWIHQQGQAQSQGANGSENGHEEEIPY